MLFLKPLSRRPIPWSRGVLLAFSLGLLQLVGGETARARSLQSNAPTEKSVFRIRSGDRQVGTETFTIRRTDSGFEASGELELEMPGGGQVSENCLLRLDLDLAPTDYQREQRAPKKGSLQVRFDPSEARLTSSTDAGNQDEIFYLSQRNLVVLDTNFFHQYSFLVRRYDSSGPEAQQFSVLVPQEATPGSIRLTRAGKESLKVGDATLEVNHFQAATEDVQIEIWATPQGEIQRISIPQANLEVTREGKDERSE